MQLKSQFQNVIRAQFKLIHEIRSLCANSVQICSLSRALLTQLILLPRVYYLTNFYEILTGDSPSNSLSLKKKKIENRLKNVATRTVFVGLVGADVAWKHRGLSRVKGSHPADAPYGCLWLSCERLFCPRRNFRRGL